MAIGKKIVKKQEKKQLQVVKTHIETKEYAGFVVRVAATFIDSVIIALIWIVIVLTTVLAIVAPLVGWVYYVLSDVKMSGQTFGKKFFKIKVVADGAQNIDWATAIMREVVGRFFSGLVFGLGFFWIIWDKEKQGWLDKIAKTHVVHVEDLSTGRNTLKWLFFALMIVGPVLVIAASLVILLSLGNYLSTKTRPSEGSTPPVQQEEQEIDLPDLSKPKFNFSLGFIGSTRGMDKVFNGAVLGIRSFK